MNNLTPEQETELSSVYDERQDAIRECSPEVARALGYKTAEDATHLLMLPCLMFGHTNLLPFQLHPEAVRRFARDLIDDVLEARKARESFDFQFTKSQALGEVWEQQHELLGLNRGKVPEEREKRTAHHMKVKAAIEATEEFRLALADQVLAGEQLRRNIQQWAIIYWRNEINLIAFEPGSKQISLFEAIESPTPRSDAKPYNPLETGELVVIGSDYPIYTSQETDALLSSASDGKRGSYWRNEMARDRRVWERKGFSHHVEIARGGDEETPPASWEALEKLTGEQDGDFALALFYVAGLLCPTPDSGRPAIGRGIIDLNDVMGKIGWLRQKPDAAKTEELRRKLWRFLVFGEEAWVIGTRSVKYKNPQTGEEMPTRIESPVWRILSKQYPEQKTLFNELKPAPVAVEIAVSQQFERIFSDPVFAQFMPLGELLGAIPPNKVGGDWARIIGLTLARSWRCHLHEAKAKTLRIKRQNVLTHFAPKTQTVQEILSTDKPKRAVAYYRDALNILLETGLIAPEGDAAKDMTPDKMLEPYGRQGWGDKWLSDMCNLHPGPKWEPVIEQLAENKYLPKPRDLAAKKQRKPRTKKVA